MTPEERDALEALIDRTSLREVLEGVTAIAREKAEHVRTTWQDERTASHWDKAADRLESTTASVWVQL